MELLFYMDVTKYKSDSQKDSIELFTKHDLQEWNPKDVSLGVLEPLRDFMQSKTISFLILKPAN